MQVHQSALRHGVSAEDGTYAAEHWVYVADLDEESPQRELRLGFDTGIIHAMKARPQYIDLIT